MKCLCCDANFEGLDLLKQRYVEVHGVDENNYFFRKLFTRDEYFCPRSSFRCEYFCLNDRDEKIHNFREHYQQGGTLPAEDKPVNITNFERDLQRYCITFNEHGENYDFYDPPEIISEFFVAFQKNFIPRQNLKPVLLKCTFTIINRQPPLNAGFVEVTDIRVWTTNVYEGIIFNNFVKLNMVEDIKTRRIFNGMAGSSWRFKRFERLCISVKSEDIQKMRCCCFNFIYLFIQHGIC